MELAMQHADIGLIRLVIVNYTAGVLEPIDSFKLPVNNMSDTSQCPGVRQTTIPLMHGPFDDAWTAPPAGVNFSSIHDSGPVDVAMAAVLSGMHVRILTPTEELCTTCYLYTSLSCDYGGFSCGDSYT